METGLNKAGTRHFTGKARKRAAVVAMIIATTGAAGVAAGPAGASSLAPRPAPAVTGTEHFQIMTTSGTATKVGFIMYGLFTAEGVDHEGTPTGTFSTADGTFKVTHSIPAGPQTFNPKTCLSTDNGHGTYTITDGTGAYEGITGQGKYTVTVLDIQPRTKSGACDENAAPTAFQQVIDGSGPITGP